jgi:Holliday junction resolvase RusA-like endonuclease
VVIELVVAGIPEPQGSKTAMIRRSGPPENWYAYVIEGSSDDGRRRFREWRASVAEEARKALIGREALDEPVAVSIEFRFPRGIDDYRVRHAVGPDLDKCLRTVLDALCTDAGLIVNDSRVCETHVRSRFVPTDHALGTGATIRIYPQGDVERTDQEIVRRAQATKRRHGRLTAANNRDPAKGESDGR